MEPEAGTLLLTFTDSADKSAILEKIKTSELVTGTTLLEAVGIGIVNTKDASQVMLSLEKMEGVATVEKDGIMSIAGVASVEKDAGEPEAKKAKTEGESYYKIIDGVKYDRTLLEWVEKFAADGQVGYPEAKKLWRFAEDGKGVTDIEKATLEYSMKTYKFTDKATNFVKTYLEVGTHKSYYKVINGVKYDRALLEEAMVDVADGQVSWKEAKQLFADAQDGKGLTGTEKDTLEYILKTMKFTDKARTYLTNQLTVPAPKSYYKIIDGVKYDHALLLECEDACKDGVISEAEAKRLYEEACDGKGITDIEAGTLKCALKTFKFTDPAKEFLTKTLGA